MTRARKTRSQRNRGRTPSRSIPAPLGAEELLGGGNPRLDLARRRARFAKAVFGTGGAVVFGAAMFFARQSFAGHPKSPAHPLVAPPRFVSIVRKNLLQAGVVAPAQAPPGATTSVS
jgi:hypothetical protein